MDKIRNGDVSWSESVPDEVFSIISERGLFQEKDAAKKTDMKKDNPKNRPYPSLDVLCMR